MVSVPSLFDSSLYPGIATVLSVLHPEIPDVTIRDLINHFKDPDFDFIEFFDWLFKKKNDFESIYADKEILKKRLNRYKTLLLANKEALDELLPHLPRSLRKPINLKFNATPFEIASVLKKHVKGQDAAVYSFSMAMYLHLYKNGYIAGKDSRYEKLPQMTPFLVGNSGSGKTFLIEIFCENYGVPSIIIDCSSITPSGYYGDSISDMFAQLHVKYDGDLSYMEKAIICLDEFDKVSMYGQSLSENYNTEFKRSVQTELLKIIDMRKGHKTAYHIGTGSSQQRHFINTSNMTFVLSGACSGLDEVVDQRTNKQKIGFSGGSSLSSRPEPTDKDFIKYGFIPELVGRISNFIFLRNLTVDQLIEILTTSNSSPLKEYELFFSLHGEELTLDESILKKMAEDAVKRNLGVRGLYKTLATHFQPKMYDLNYQ